MGKLFGSDIRRIPTRERVVALTFNAAWDEAGLDTVLKVLRRQDASATFFPTGQFAERHPSAVRAMAVAGHGIANHSYGPPCDALTGEERKAEVEQADRAIHAAAGVAPLPFFRFPYGDLTCGQVAEANALGAGHPCTA
ncbi:polysaccharide deacetylase family protein [Saccharothrix sp. ST-888]|uniref:polysaccharide deacetylase family protein n=1 Tax=Saccharothrix sp. ST-888 TaxID=1427391 RepID=UPI0006970671|nr:polysaccharide deacetylase family protein [Saccharothrix sp. ST-888]